MSSYILVKYLHLVSILAMVSLLVVELFLLKPEMTRGELKKLARVDGFYGLAAIAVVAAGLTLWFGVGKGDAFYNNPILYVKVGIAIFVGVISIVPTVFYLRQAKGISDDRLTVQAVGSPAVAIAIAGSAVGGNDGPGNSIVDNWLAGLK